MSVRNVLRIIAFIVSVFVIAGDAQQYPPLYGHYNPNTLPWGGYYIEHPPTPPIPQGYGILFGRVVFSETTLIPYAGFNMMTAGIGAYARRGDAEEKFSQFLDYVRNNYKTGPQGFDQDMLSFASSNYYPATSFILLPECPDPTCVVYIGR